MIRQTILPFKLEMTRHLMTPHAGLALVVEFAVGLGFLKSADRYLPTLVVVGDTTPLSMSSPSSRCSMEAAGASKDTRKIRTDEELREVLPLERIPSSNAFGASN